MDVSRKTIMKYKQNSEDGQPLSELFSRKKRIDLDDGSGTHADVLLDDDETEEDTKGKKMSDTKEEPTTNAGDLVTNAIRSHNNDLWYMELLEQAIDRCDTVSEAIVVANSAYENNPTPTINEDEEEETETVEDDGGDEEYEDEDEYESDGILDNNNLALNAAIEEALDTSFSSGDTDDEEDNESEEEDDEYMEDEE